MTKEKLQEILEKHQLCVNGKNGGECADLRGADLEDEDLSHVDLRRVDLSYAFLSHANLRHAILQHVDLSGATLLNVDLSHANLRNAIIRHVDLRHATLRGADLRGALLSDANLHSVDLSGAKGLLSAADFLERCFERTDEGYIAYKVFGAQYEPPKEWEIVPGAILTETVNPDRCTECGSGINVAPLKWVKKLYPGVKPIWKVLIKWEWLPGVIVPYMTDGKIRCEKVQLIGTVGCGGEADE